ncbi:chemotaxis protein CheA [Paenibacillus lemnae]|uniref:Chemotaxis protein CheA n=1 Tax=Paenibacillus lemnae TaxID=1330551 RepID=A0A848M4Z7_PAELE|nr:chemotaxis protein CheA [Paenibacillus lemnae]NMO95182.1 chemotaxis protein CheA [Paenibacillus lemnae]
MQSEYRELFLEELDEQLEVMDHGILKLEQETDKKEAVQSLFRAAHTLKGSSAAMGFESMKLLTHEMEHLLDKVRSEKLLVCPALIDLLFQVLDHLKLLKMEIVEEVGGYTDISSILLKLQRFEDEFFSIKKSSASSTVRNHGVKPKLDQADWMKVTEYVQQQLHVHWITIRISADCLIKGARAYIIQAGLAETGEMILVSPDAADVEEHTDAPLDLVILHACAMDAEQLMEYLSGYTDIESAYVEPLQPEEIETSQSQSQYEFKNTNETSAPVKSKSQTVRVSVERLEHLMNLVGELVIDQKRIHQVEQIQKRRFSDDSVKELSHISDHLSRVIGDLQDSVMKARMLPIEHLLNRFPRMIRDLSRDLGKEMDLIIEGKETELDRTLIEEISDPLIHLIRNAADHGIETSEVRSACGKSPKGMLRIRAAHEDNQVVIYVEDDGAGIHSDKMKDSAVAKGVLTRAEAEALSDREAVELIFRPGFSTASRVSDVSGRGVGMDIVKSHIEKLNGLIEIETSPGQGTQFKIKLPLTLAIIEGLLFRTADQTLIIPMSNIAEIVRIKTDDLILLRGKPVIRLRDQIIPVSRLEEHFHMKYTETSLKQQYSLIIAGSAEKRIALVADELLGNQEIVVKSLGQYIGKVPGIAGGTILGDGNVALILEISSLINRREKSRMQGGLLDERQRA